MNYPSFSKPFHSRNVFTLEFTDFKDMSFSVTSKLIPEGLQISRISITFQLDDPPKRVARWGGLIISNERFSWILEAFDKKNKKSIGPHIRISDGVSTFILPIPCCLV